MPHQVKFLILGAGPSGLAFAHALLDRGEDSFVILEKESAPGGLCRSSDVDGAPLDIGGGHFLDVRRPDVIDLLFRFMPESEWNRHSRVAKIRLHGVEIDHPLEANLWQLPNQVQADYIEAIAEAGCVRGEPMPTAFEDWCRWKFGKCIAEDYMLPYNRKIWRLPLKNLGTYWLNKLPDVSFRETLLSCLKRQALGGVPAHSEFYYPKSNGFGEVWRRMGEALGDRLLLNTPVTSIQLADKLVNGEFKADRIINSIPWPVWAPTANLPKEIVNAIRLLVHAPIDIDYSPEIISGNAHWIYEPDESVRYHRILARSNFVTGARGCWTETNSQASMLSETFRHHNEFAYPVNTINKPQAMDAIHTWAKSERIIPIGRWGRWEHINSDVAVSLALEAANSALLNSI